MSALSVRGPHLKTNLLAVSAVLTFSTLARAQEPVLERDERCDAYPNDCARSPRATAPPPRPMPVTRGWQLGGHIAYELPLGSFEAASPPKTSPLVSDIDKAWVAFDFDAGFRFTRYVYLGGSLAWGPALSGGGDFCGASGNSCAGHVAQLLVDARFYAAPDANVGAWFGVGGGWELATVVVNPGTETYTGPVLANLQIGFDVRGGALAIGPYFGVAIGEMVSKSITPAPAGGTPPIDERALHDWVTFGLRGSYGPW
jgi:hypothetical protein